MKPIVVVESPFAGDVPTNLAYARAALRDCILRGEAPFASHLLYTQPGVLDDYSPDERRLGIETGFEFRRAAATTAVYADLGVSHGMLEGIAHARRTSCPVEFRSLPAFAASPAQPPRVIAEPGAVLVRETQRTGWDANGQETAEHPRVVRQIDTVVVPAEGFSAFDAIEPSRGDLDCPAVTAAGRHCVLPSEHRGDGQGDPGHEFEPSRSNVVVRDFPKGKYDGKPAHSAAGWHPDHDGHG